MLWKILTVAAGLARLLNALWSWEGCFEESVEVGRSLVGTLRAVAFVC